MNSRIRSVMSLHAREKWTWMFIPWLVLLSSFLVNFTIGLLAAPEDFTTGGLLSIVIYMMVAGILVIQQTFSFALGLCITRRSYFIGTAAAASGFILLSAALLTLLLVIEQATNGWGVDMHFFHLPYLSDSGAAMALLTFFSLLSFMFFAGVFIGSLFRRYGKKGLFIPSLALTLIFGGWLTLVAARNWWAGVGTWMLAFDWSIAQTTLAILLSALALAGGSFALLRRSTVQN